MNLNFLNRLSKNTQISNLLKIHSVGAESQSCYMQRDRRDEVNSHFLQFCEYV